MKKMFRSLMLVAVAAMAFVSCQNEEINEVLRPQEVVMTIIADADDTRTAIDEVNSKVVWSEGDQLKVIENGANYRTSQGAFIAADGKATFSVSFAADNTSTSFTYNALFPAARVVEDDKEKMDLAKVKVIIPDAQNPTATSFDPSADILIAKQITTTSQPTELSMQFKRIVALGKMTLTNLPASSTISKVTFTANGEGATAIAGRNYVDVANGTITQYGYYGNTNTITLNYQEAVASSTPIYFTCNPFELVSGEAFTVEVVCSDATYTREVALSKALAFTEGNLSKFSVDMTNATKKENFVFADGDYAAIAVNGEKFYALSSDANGTRLNAVEVSYDGGESFTTADATLKWSVAKSDDGYTFKGSNNQYVAWESGNYAKTQDDVYYLDITEDANNAGRYWVTSKSDATRKLVKNSSNPYFAFYTSEQCGSLLLIPIGENTEPYFTIFPTSTEDCTYLAEGGEIEFEVEAHNNFSAEVTATTDAEWLTIEPNGEVIYVTADKNEGAKRSAEITFAAEGYADVTVTVYQEAAANAPVVYTTVAEFLAAKEDDTTLYTLKGTITSVANTTYGNFDLTDETGTVYIYGLCSPEGANKYWAASGAKLGDDIVIKTIRTSFNNAPQGKNATFVELISPGTYPFYTVSTTAVDFASAGGEQTITVSTYNTDATVTASSDNAVFAVAVDGYNVTISSAANELEEKIEGNVTIKVGDLDATVVAVTLAAKPSEGNVEGGQDDFNTISQTNTSYVSGKTTAGWEYKNCAIFKGGTSDSSPAFKMIGDANNRALCMNGKTTAVGTITSPTITTGCGTLKFSYGLPFSDTKIKFRVDIKQDGEVVETFTVNPSSVTKLTGYTFEEAVNVSGDFQIVFTNLSPSNSTSNKDRTAIWDVEWTGYAD